MQLLYSFLNRNSVKLYFIKAFVGVRVCVAVLVRICRNFCKILCYYEQLFSVKFKLQLLLFYLFLLHTCNERLLYMCIYVCVCNKISIVLYYIYTHVVFYFTYPTSHNLSFVSYSSIESLSNFVAFIVADACTHGCYVLF